MSDRSVLLSPTNVIALSILVASSLWLAWWFFDRSRFVYVTDARVSATMVNVSSRIPGWISDFPRDEGERVGKGQVLVEIDARETRLELDEVKASLQTLETTHQKKRLELSLAEKQVTSAIRTAEAELASARAALSEARVEASRTRRELERAESLLDREMISTDEFEAREAAHDKAAEALNRYEADVATARAQLVSAEANMTRLDVLAKDLEIADRERDEVEVQQERLANRLEDHVIRSTTAGVIDETFVNPGEYVYPGQRILMLHDPDNVWIKANIKETEIRNVRVGSPVEISVDAFPDRILKGRVTHIGTAATSQFAMLPSPNPSGNFTKITQRMEVRIDFEGADATLKPGMMVELKIPVTGS